ncbi:TnpV protein [Dorea sp. AM58-8]|nr:TnpV protein [Dorea sp. AM58-8]
MLKGDWNVGLFEIFKKKSESEVKPTCDELYPHEVQAIAEKRVEVIMAGLLEKNPEPDKETDTMALVRHMNLLKEMAEEVVVREVIYE